MRRMIRERDYQKAYQLAAGHGLLSGEAFRDAEWIAGWLALEKLGDAAKAEAHFRVFGAGVATPISVSRAQYWLGEALTKQQTHSRGAGSVCGRFEVSLRFLRPAGGGEGAPANAGGDEDIFRPAPRSRPMTSAQRLRSARLCVRRSCWRKRGDLRALSGSRSRLTM
jgi:soluble lytic murein transglycosylase